ncbi:MAG: hypothetical protein HC897_11330 [Thermoanaerobaculia bacterium]|nr:hypothetical protein [Thermoanaerobaculia bacterium]
MTLPQALGPVRYALDEEGEVVDVVVPIESWKTLLTALKELLEATGGAEQHATLRAWLEAHLTSKAERQALAAVEDELRREGLL